MREDFNQFMGLDSSTTINLGLNIVDYDLGSLWRSAFRAR